MGQKQKQKPEVKKLHLISLRKAAEQKGRDWLDIIVEQNPEAVTCDGFETCVIGVAIVSECLRWLPTITTSVSRF